MVKANIEYTDTFQGEANYSWCKRATIEIDATISNQKLIAAAKQAVGAFGNFRTDMNTGDFIRLNERGACRCIFITFE